MRPRGMEKVTIRTEAVRDGFGNPGTAGTPRKFDGCAVYPRGASSEDSGRSATVLDGYTILIPGNVAVASSDEVEWARQPGIWRKVVGKPGLLVSLQGEELGTQVNVSGAEG